MPKTEQTLRQWRNIDPPPLFAPRAELEKEMNELEAPDGAVRDRVSGDVPGAQTHGLPMMRHCQTNRT
jgi:hypothetical protein